MRLQILFFLSLAINIYGKHAKKLPWKENWELETQLEILNKPPLMTIKNERGEIFDCVDIYKQPAFTNPLLKDHKLQVKPSFKTMGPSDKIPLEGSLIDLALKGGECPIGTVLIKRTTKQDLMRAKYAAAHLSNSDSSVYHIAGYATSEGTYYGSQARLNIWNSKLESYQYTQTKIHIESWAHNKDYLTTVHYVEAGWMINPTLFGDLETHLFGAWTADNANKTGCYNTLCPGFVQTSQSTTLGTILKPYSEFNKTQTEIILHIIKDYESHNWWLLHGPNYTAIGYWPKELFTNLSVSAKQLVWCGEAGTLPGHPFPPMGSGHFPNDAMGMATYIGQIQLISDDHRLRDVVDNEVSGLTDGPKYYNAGPALEEDHVPGGGYGIFIGGPGGKDCGH